nr:ribonuclease H-like domain-containing protein [Tanacetum cinerariifolium]
MRFSDPNWQNAMRDEYNELIKNRTWILVPRPTDTNIVRYMWLFRHKYLAAGTLSRYKARLVANGSTQLEGVDDETFSPVVKPDTILTVLSLAVSQYWSIHQLDVKNDFVHDDLYETVYMRFVTLHILIMCVYYSGQSMGSNAYGDCNSSRTPVDTESKLGDEGDPVSDPTLYRSLAEPHFSALKRVLRYVRGTLDYGLQLFSSSITDLVAYLDADWAEAEYRGVANAVAETCWLRNLLCELHKPLSSATLVYCDNVNAVYLFCNPVQHQRTKHIEIHIHFVHDLNAAGKVRVLHVPSCYHSVHACSYKACNGSIAAECKVFVREEEEFMMIQKNMGGFLRLLTVRMYFLDFKRSSRT